MLKHFRMKSLVVICKELLIPLVLSTHYIGQKQADAWIWLNKPPLLHNIGHSAWSGTATEQDNANHGVYMDVLNIVKNFS
jgi:hypothetical protein